MKLTILGSGTSQGVPVIACSCAVCRSKDPKDKRTRSSLYVEGPAGEKAVIDTSTEFRLQALKSGITGLDAVFLTHAHADHVHGLDDIRPLSWEKPIPIYGCAHTISEFIERFSYIFRETQAGGGKPQIEVKAVDKPVKIGNLLFTPIPIMHGNLLIYGWKIIETLTAKKKYTNNSEYNGVVYLTDCSYISPASYELITSEKLPVCAIVGGLRIRPLATHFCFDQAIDAGLKTGAKEIWLTHICHEQSQKEITKYCNKYSSPGRRVKIGPAWDGQKLTL